jgi:regulator of PEP synthase PpsR (kinase-PPPase family)
MTRGSHIFVVSDATGETAERMAQAALSQFANARTVVTRHHYIRTHAQVDQVLQEAYSEKGLIIYTLVSEEFRTKLREEAGSRGIIAVDLMGPLLSALAQFLHAPPQAQPGLLHRIDTEYFRRIEAVQFTVKHDDGQSLQTLAQADIVLVGPSRTAKTPLSMYLAQYGYKVANVPIILNLPVPKELFKVDPEKVVALAIDAERLLEVRRARVRHLTRSVPGYAEIEAIRLELNYCRELYRQNPHWHLLDVSGRAVEEVASDIIILIQRAR